jgi:hypothetical protein
VDTSTAAACGSRQLRQSMIPSRRENTDANETSAASGTRACSQLSRAQSPDVQSEPIIRPRPARCSRMTTARSNSSTGCAAPGARIGLPSVTMPSTRSGRRPARPRASSPPRLCPMTMTLRPRLSAMASTRRSRASDAAWVQPTFACMVDR